MQKLTNGLWVECNEEDLLVGDTYRINVGGGWEQKKYPKQDLDPIIVTVTLSKYKCLLGDSVEYSINFSEPLTVDQIVPISVTDRNGDHVTNIGCSVNNGVSSGSFTMTETGDFTVTNESINYHSSSIPVKLKIDKEFWLRVYQ